MGKTSFVFDKVKLDAWIKSFHFPSDTSSGNCGQFAIALFYILNELGLDVSLGLASNDWPEEDLFNGEPDIYHVYVEIKDKNKEYYFDSTGVLSVNQLHKFVAKFYPQKYSERDFAFFGDYDPTNKRHFSLINGNTDWTKTWQAYLKQLDKKKPLLKA